MASEKMIKQLNDQINREFSSAYFYLSMEAYFANENLPGFANFFRVQVQEERDHAIRLFDYINKIGGKVELAQISAPPAEFDSIVEVFRLGLEHEKFVTRSIYDLVDTAIAEKDYTTHTFLQWFINEQAEEESSFDAALRKVKLVANDGKGILILDTEMAQRVYTPPVPAQ